MLGIWLGVALVNISGYQPIAEQTWVQLNPEYYPVHSAVPPLFLAWRGNQFPPLAQKKKNGRWQILFPARVVPPFELFEGEAELSKAYLARLKRIDEMAYGMAPHQPIAPAPNLSTVPVAVGGQPFIAEFFLPGAMTGRGRVAQGEPLLARLAVPSLSGAGGSVQFAAASPAPEGAMLTLSAAVVGGETRVCHQVTAGETLWRIASQLVAQEKAADTYSYLLALAADNSASMGRGIKVRTGQRLYCPKAETLAQFDAMSPAQRQQQFARLEQGH